MLSDTMNRFDKIDVILRLRNDGKFVPLAEVLAWDGRRLRVMVGEEIEPGESSLYVGELRCDVLTEGFPRTWIASGDLAPA